MASNPRKTSTSSKRKYAVKEVVLTSPRKHITAFHVQDIHDKKDPGAIYLARSKDHAIKMHDELAPPLKEPRSVKKPGK